MEISRSDLILVNELYNRKYSENSLLSNASMDERIQLLDIRRRLKAVADHFADIYKERFGPFDTEMSTGNPVAQSANLNNVWAGLFKGNSNKQYAAQISFVVNRYEPCLDVGFYFGRASSRNLSKLEREDLENQFQQLGKNLASSLKTNNLLQGRFNEIFEFGFKSYLNSEPASPFEWRTGISDNPKASQITLQIYPKENKIDIAEIDFAVSQIIFLMGFVNISAAPDTEIPAITLNQYLKKAERQAEIGLKGELFILEMEHKKLDRLGYLSLAYPRHVALESNIFGYDILSKDKDGNDIFIEVKTTTRNIEDPYSRQFFLTSYEYQTYENNRERYKIARVYNVENNPVVEYLNIKDLVKRANGFIVEY